MIPIHFIIYNPSWIHNFRIRAKYDQPHKVLGLTVAIAALDPYCDKTRQSDSSCSDRWTGAVLKLHQQKGKIYAHSSDPVHSSGIPHIRDFIKDPDHLKLYMTLSLYSSLVL